MPFLPDFHDIMDDIINNLPDPNGGATNNDTGTDTGDISSNRDNPDFGQNSGVDTSHGIDLTIDTDVQTFTAAGPINNVTVIDGASIDTLTLNGKDNTLFGSDAGFINTLFAGDGDDTVILGDAGAGQVNLGAGDDTITTDGAVGQIFAGTGDDALFIDVREGADAIAFDGGDGRDTVNITAEELADLDLLEFMEDMQEMRDTGTATLDDFGLTLTDVEVINLIVDGQSYQIFDIDNFA